MNGDVVVHAQQISRRLRVEYPELDHDVLTTMVHEAFDRTRDARVQQFRALLAERQVREDLGRARSRRTSPTPNSILDVEPSRS